jgi:hypothetical protein
LTQGEYLRGKHVDNRDNVGVVIETSEWQATVWWLHSKRRSTLSWETASDRYVTVTREEAAAVVGEEAMANVPPLRRARVEQPPARATLNIELDGDDARRWLELKAKRASVVASLGGELTDAGLVRALVRAEYETTFGKLGGMSPTQQPLFGEKE